MNELLEIVSVALVCPLILFFIQDLYILYVDIQLALLKRNVEKDKKMLNEIIAMHEQSLKTL